MKLHIGCGKRFIQGYKHVDIISYEHIDFVQDAMDLHLIQNETVSEIYACHVLEHFKRHQIETVLIEWNRVLKVGGVLRLSVPNFNAIIEEYLQHGDISKLQGLLYGGQTYDYNFHHVVFDLEHITLLLVNAGFGNVNTYNWQDFLPPNFDDFSRAYLPHLDTNGRLMSLNIVATKIGS